MEDYTFVDIGKKQYPIRFGFNALRKYSMKTNTTLNDLNKLGAEMSLEEALQLIFCGIEDGYRKAKQEMDIKSIDDLADLIDTDYDAIARCMEVLTTMLTESGGKKQKAKKEN